MSLSFFKYHSPSFLPLLCSLLTCTFLLSPSAHSAERFFTPPEASFITSLKEQIHRIDLPAGTAETAQTLIDRARKEMPDTFLLIQTSGNLEVGPTPLRLSSNMALHLSSSAGIVASPSCSAPCLILIEKSELVSISSSGSGSATLDGAGKLVSGIQITKGSRINIDQLKILHCAKTGIDYRGTTNVTSLNEAASVTRCYFEKIFSK